MYRDNILICYYGILAPYVMHDDTKLNFPLRKGMHLLPPASYIGVTQQFLPNSATATSLASNTLNARISSRNKEGCAAMDSPGANALVIVPT